MALSVLTVEVVGSSTRDEARALMSLWAVLVPVSALAGGWFADRFLGQRRAAIYGSATALAGYVLLAIVDPARPHAGLALVLAGTALIQPSLASLVGAQQPRDDARRTSAYSFSRASVLVAAALAPMIVSPLAEADGLGRITSAVLVVFAIPLGALACFVSVSGARSHVIDPAKPPATERSPWPGVLGIGLLAAAVYLVLRVARFERGDRVADWITVIATLGGLGALFGRWPRTQHLRFLAVLIVLATTVFFWSVNDFTTLTLLRGETDAFGQFNTLNHVATIAALLALAWLWPRLKRRELPMATILGLALMVAGLGQAALLVGAELESSFMIALYASAILLSVAEACLIPVALSAISKLAPAGTTGFLMALWILSAANGSILSRALLDPSGPRPPATQSFALFAAITLASGAALAMTSSRLARAFAKGEGEPTPPIRSAPPDRAPSRESEARANRRLRVGTTAVVVLLAGFAAYSAWPVVTEKRAAGRDADPLALPIAAATRALVRGASLDGIRDERRAFPRVDRFAWRERATVLTKDEVDRAWWSALERIAKNPRYADLRGELAPEFEQAPFSEARLAELERYLGFARDGRLIPLGPNRDTKPGTASEPPAIDGGLEEFAVVGTGEIRLRHPETGVATLERGSAMVLVLIPGVNAETLSEAAMELAKIDDATALDNQPMLRRLRSLVRAQQIDESITLPSAFFLSKTELTATQLPELGGASSARDASATSNWPLTSLPWDAGRARIEALGLRLPTEAEWEYAAGVDAVETLDAVAWHAGNASNALHDVATRAPNDFGLFDMFGNAAEFCSGDADYAAGGPSSAQTSMPSAGMSVVRGGNATESAERLAASRSLTPAGVSSEWIGLRAAYDIRPPDPPAMSTPPRESAPSNADREETKQGAKKK